MIALALVTNDEQGPTSGVRRLFHDVEHLELVAAPGHEPVALLLWGVAPEILVLLVPRELPGAEPVGERRDLESRKLPLELSSDLLAVLAGVAEVVERTREHLRSNSGDPRLGRAGAADDFEVLSTECVEFVAQRPGLGVVGDPEGVNRLRHASIVGEAS